MIHTRSYMRKDGKQKPIRLYSIWRHMRSRCRCITHPLYHRYGGRGIAICGQWMDFTAFREWAIAAGYGKGLSIDRIDNDGNYTPDNCQWITPGQNSRKKPHRNGTNHQNSIFTTEQVQAIRSDERFPSAIARDYGCAAHTIWKVRNYLSYRNL